MTVRKYLCLTVGRYSQDNGRTRIYQVGLIIEAIHATPPTGCHYPLHQPLNERFSNMLNKKEKYKLKALINPKHWLRNYKTHKAWDEWLWGSLQNHEIKVLDKYYAEINGKKVWICNYPYASGQYDGSNYYSCSRATNILLFEKIQKKLPF